MHNNYIVFPHLFPHYRCQNAYGARSRDIYYLMWQGTVAWSLYILKIHDGAIKRRVYSLVVEPCDMRRRRRRSSLTSIRQSLRLSDTGATEVNRIFVGKTSRYEYLCMLYDLARALEKSGELATSRGHRICAVECKYILKYIKKDRAREWER